jgi:hypothetical protein
MKRLISLCAALALTLALVLPAAAYVTSKSKYSSVDLKWTSLPMKFNIDQKTPPGVSSADKNTAVRNAYKTWSNVSCSFYASSDQGTVNTATGNSKDYVNSNVWISSWPSNYGQTALAITTTSYDPQSGKIYDADIKYNPNYSWAVNGAGNKIDIQSVATHEIGHELGLDHSQYQDATMFWSTGQGDTSQRSLHSDDIAGVCYIYPSGSPPPPECTNPAQCAPNETCTNGKCVNATQKGYGATCNSGKDCTSSICLKSGNTTFCSQMCASAPCPNGDQCLSLSGGGKACLPGSANMGTKLLGDPCQSNLDCKSDICVSVPGSGYLCSQKCDIKSNNCPNNYTCANSSIGGLCIPGSKTQPPPPPPPPPKGKIGEACKSHSECESNLCSGEYCIKYCDPASANACPAGFECQPEAGGKNVCFKQGTTNPPPIPPTPKEYGEDCKEHKDCKSGICAGYGDKSFCTKYCTAGQECGEGYDCLAAGDKSVCGPFAPDDSGCAVSGDDAQEPGNWPLLILLLPLLILIRRARD